MNSPEALIPVSPPAARSQTIRRWLGRSTIEYSSPGRQLMQSTSARFMAPICQVNVPRKRLCNRWTVEIIQLKPLIVIVERML